MSEDPYKPPTEDLSFVQTEEGASTELRLFTGISTVLTGVAWQAMCVLSVWDEFARARGYEAAGAVMGGGLFLLFVGLYFVAGLRLLRGERRTKMLLWMLGLGVAASVIAIVINHQQLGRIHWIFWVRTAINLIGLVSAVLFRRATPPPPETGSEEK